MARLTQAEARTAARLAMKAAQEEAARERAERPVRAFWDLVDTSAGPDACHPWRGSFRPGGGIPQPWYEPGLRSAGWGTSLARRLVCFLTFGVHVPNDRDTTNLCDHDGCCNVRHIVISPRGRDHADRLRRGIPAEEFFCDRVHVRD